MHLVDALLGQILGRILPNGESDLALLEGVSAKDMERGACSAPRGTYARLRNGTDSECQECVAFVCGVCVRVRGSVFTLIREAGVLLLEGARGVHVGRGEGDRRVGLAGLRVGRVVDASDAHSERDREGVALGGDGHLVQHDRLEVALGLAGALQVGKLALLEDGTRGLGRGRRKLP